MCVNGSTQQVYILREKEASPTAASEAIIATGVIDSTHRRDLMRLDTPKSFAQTEIALYKDKIIIKIRGQLVDIIIEFCPGV